MLRRSLLSLPALAAPGLLLAGAGMPATARAQAAPASAAIDPAVRTTIENYMNGLTTMKARFLQLAQNNGAAEGTAWIWRPGRMRFEYDTTPMLLVANQGQFFYFDKQMHQVSTLPIGSTPLGLLLRPKLQLSGDISVASVQRQNGMLALTVYESQNPGQGQLTLYFSENPVQLLQWRVLDAQGQETRVTLSQIEVGGKFDPFLFAANDPRFREELGIE